LHTKNNQNKNINTKLMLFIDLLAFLGVSLVLSLKP